MKQLGIYTLGLVALIAAIGVVTAPAAADQITIVSDRDNTMFEDTLGTVSNGQGPVIFSGRQGQGLVRRALLRFDIAGALPVGAVVTAVSLELDMQDTSDMMSRDMSLFRVGMDWGEGASNANGGQGDTAQVGDATWLHTFYNTALWTTPGGDFDAMPSATQTVGTAAGAYTWSDTSMANDVQAWLDSPGSNFGWVLIGVETVNRTSRRFGSREAGAGQPTLTITYDAPLPTREASWGRVKNGFAR